MKQGDKITAKIIDYGANGEGVAKLDGFVVFIPYTVAGETVEARITYAKKNFAIATLLKIIHPSPERTSYPCNRFGRCGGCNLLHISYPEQLRLKENALKTTMEKAGLKNLPYNEIVPSDLVYGYRNKVQLPLGIVNGKAAVGFYREGTHKIVSITKCFLHGEWLETLIDIVLNFANTHNISVYDEKAGTGLLRHLTARYLDGNLTVVLVTTNERLPFSDKLVTMLVEKFPDCSLYLSVNSEKTNVIMGKKLITLKASDTEYNASGIMMTVHPNSFLQVNDNVREKLYNKVVDSLKGSDIVIDTYSGVGLIGAYLVKKGIKHVYNIEIVPEATADADKLAKRNGLQQHITNITGDASKLLPEVLALAQKEHPQSLSVLVDPPRKGISSALIQTIKSAYVPKLIYISCNPATLARDLKLLTEGGTYKVNAVTPFDMFPNTRHVETVVLMSRVEK